MTAPFSYRVVPDGNQHAVVCIHVETPDWWHVVARFADAERARRYAEVEGDCANDEFHDNSAGPAWEGDEKPAPVADLPAPPPTRVAPENFRPPSPAEKARVGAALIGEAAEEAGGVARITVSRPAPTEIDCDPSYPRAWGEQDDLLRELWPDLSLDVPAIAKRLNRTPAAVYGRATHLRLGPRPRKSPTVEERRDSQERTAERAAPSAPALVFTRTTSVERPPSKAKPSTPPPVAKKPAPGAPKEPVAASERDLVRFLAKDIGLKVFGPDEESKYVVDTQRNCRGPQLLARANYWRQKRGEPPFQLLT